MILKGSQRSGAGQLAAHLMNDIDNDHVTLHELRGFMSEDLEGALSEAHAISKATQCRQFMFSLSLNPPKDADCSVQALVDAADRAEEALGLEGQPRAIVVHEKQGRRHAHVVWSRIDTDDMKAVPMSFFKNRLTTLSKELYLEHGWDLPDGHKENGWKNPLNFTLEEWQQAKRLGLDPRELKQVFQEAWRRSDSLRAFRGALEDHGYYLAKGDRRGFVAVDLQGEVFSVSRMTGVKTKDLNARLGSPDGLPSVELVVQDNAQRMTDRMRGLLADVREKHEAELKALALERRAIIEAQRVERLQLQNAQEQRRSRETAERQARFRGGVRGLWDVLTGRAAAIRRENEAAAFAGYRRDVEQREQLFEAQMDERHEITEQLAKRREAQRQERMRTSSQVSTLLGLERMQRAPVHELPANKSRSLEID